MTGKTYNFTPISQYYWIIGELGKNIKKTNIKNDVCLHSEQVGLTNLFSLNVYVSVSFSNPYDACLDECLAYFEKWFDAFSQWPYQPYL